MSGLGAIITFFCRFASTVWNKYVILNKSYLLKVLGITLFNPEAQEAWECYHSNFPSRTKESTLHFPRPPGQGSVAALPSCRRSYSVQEPAHISHWRGLASLHPEEGSLCHCSCTWPPASAVLFCFFFSHSLCPKSPLSWLSIFSKFYPGEPNPITRALKSRVLSLAGVRIDVAEEEVREIRRMRGTLPPLLEGATWKARGGLWVASRSKDGRQPGRKRTSVLPPRGTESDQKLE